MRALLALRRRADAAAAAGTDPARAPVDAPLRPWPLDRRPHQRVRSLEHGPQLGVVHLLEAPPRRDARLPEGLGLPEVPDPGHEPLVEQRVADLALGLGAQAREHRLEVGRLAEDVRTEPRCAASADQLEHGAVPEDGLVLGAPQDEPRLPHPRRPRRSTRQRPFIRKWLRRTRPPSKWSRRFFPTASTCSSRRPSSRSASPFTAARGCGVSTSTRSPTRTCSRWAARCSESPSGTPGSLRLSRAEALHRSSLVARSRVRRRGGDLDGDRRRPVL